jgi:hypothetical protein
MTAALKQRTALRRPFAATVAIWSKRRLNFLHALDALRAQRFLHYAPIFNHLNFLEVGTELTPSCFHREAASISKLSRLTTTFTLRHIRLILSYLSGVNICKRGSYHSLLVLSMRETESGDDRNDR